MSIPSAPKETAALQPQPTQPGLDPAFLFAAMRRGFGRACPKCGEGHLFVGYLTPRAVCEHCGVDTGQIYTADIAPYFTILIVGHLIVPALLVTEQLAHPALWLQSVIWPTLTLLLALWFLPRVKGCIMGLMWALGMRGHERQ
jgi:uncharacterized protein (DUF983 family)